jgi:hypothetical protein
MPSRSFESSGASGVARLLFAGVALALAAAACSSANATLPALPSSSVASASGTPVPSSAATPTSTVAPADTSTAAPTEAATPTPRPATPAPKATPAPLPPLAIGLCSGAQLSLSITLWSNDGSISYAHITATNVSSGSCNMRGTPQTQIVDGHGSVIGDAGAAEGEVKTTDTVYTLAPNGTINDIVTWGNWCKAAPAQNVRVAVVMPFGLGRIVAPALGAPTIPSCYAKGNPTSVTAEKWTP